jgi:2-dehydropantoate 2-reductase
VRVAVVGAGAVGSLMGARLGEAGHEVLLVGRAEHVAEIRSIGLKITGAVHGTFRLRADEAIPADFRPEAILWTVKTFDLDASAPLLVRGSPKPVPTLLPQNGLRVEERAVPALRAAGWADPERVVVRAVTFVPATFVAPGKVRATGRLEMVLPAPTGASAAAARLFGSLLTSAGIAVRLSAILERDVWQKAVVNAAINPVTALHGVTNGALAAEPLRAEALELLEEARRAAETAGYRFSPEETRREFDRVVTATADNRSSMLQDVDRGRATEVEAISGEILRTGEAAGLDLPATRRVADALRRRAPGQSS